MSVSKIKRCTEHSALKSNGFTSFWSDIVTAFQNSFPRAAIVTLVKQKVALFSPILLQVYHFGRLQAPVDCRLYKLD